MKRDEHRVFLKLNGKDLSPEKKDKPKKNNSTTNTSTHQLKKIIEKKRRTVSIPKNQTKDKRSVFLSFLSITGGATAVGLLFGFMTMHLFTESDPPVSASYEEESVAVIADYGDSHTLYIIQAGAFTSKEKGTEMQKQLRTQGYPALLTHDGDYYYLFTNMSFDKETSEKTARDYEEEGIDVFEKTRTISRIKNAEEDETKALLSEIEELFINLTTGEREGEGEIDALQTIIEDSSDWSEEESSLRFLRESLIEVEKQMNEEEEMSSTTKEWLMEAILHYEEAIYAIEEEGKEE